jgi:hypothetical protein
MINVERAWTDAVNTHSLLRNVDAITRGGSDPVVAERITGIWFGHADHSRAAVVTALTTFADDLDHRAKEMETSDWPRLRQAAPDVAAAAAGLRKAAAQPMPWHAQVSELAGMADAQVAAHRAYDAVDAATHAPTIPDLVHLHVEQEMTEPSPDAYLFGPVAGDPTLSNTLAAARILTDVHPDAVPEDLRPAAKLSVALVQNADAHGGRPDAKLARPVLEALQGAGIDTKPHPLSWGSGI